MDILTVSNQMLVLLIMLVVGVVACKTGLIDKAANVTLSRVAVNICQSGMILSAVMNVEPALSGGELVWLVCVSFISYAIFGAIAFFSPIILRTERGDRGVYRFMTMFGNVAFIGYPVIGSIFGPEAIFYASLYNIPFNFLTYSIGVIFMTGGLKDGAFNWRLIINAPTCALAVSLIIFFFRIPIPGPLAEAAASVGAAVIPFSMFVIGGSLGGISLKKVFGDWRLYLFMPIKLVVCPVVAWSLLRLFVTSELILGIATVLAAMPVAALTTMLAIKYEANESVASRGVFLSTVMSVITIPLIVSLLLG